jgi:hypothetical protein
MFSESDNIVETRARGTRADAVRGNAYYLFKNVSGLRATYQTRLLAFLAQRDGGRLVIRLPAHAQIHQSLRNLLEQLPDAITIERV